jgi:hypothetical protein
MNSDLHSLELGAYTNAIHAAPWRYFSGTMLLRNKLDDCMAEDAVAYELSSPLHSLLSGKNTGNYTWFP